LIAFNVTRRGREIAIRIALGTPQKMVQRMVLREAFLLAGTGIAIGVPCSIAFSKLITSILYGVSGHDPLTIAIVAITLFAVAALAAFAPARRATHVDPIASLRSE
jgi:putative ABC transport system permease protein